MRSRIKKTVVAIIIIALVLLILSAFRSDNPEPAIAECQTDADCVPAGCCHSTSCVLSSAQPDCSTSFCTQECAPGTLDCGQGSCSCNQGKCQVVFNE